MSTHFDIVGGVELDVDAFVAFCATPTAWWTTLEPGRERIEASAALNARATTRHGAPAVVVTGNGLYRNLRTLTADVADAQRAGRVDGAFQIECTDGANSMEVAVYDADTGRLLYGASSCLHADVPAGPAVERTLELGPSVPPLRFLLPDPAAFELVVSCAAQSDCGCGGWDDDTPRCTGTADTSADLADLDVDHVDVSELAAEPVDVDVDATEALLTAALERTEPGSDADVGLGRFCFEAARHLALPGPFATWLERRPVPAAASVTVRWQPDVFQALDRVDSGLDRTARPVGEVAGTTYAGFVACDPDTPEAITVDGPDHHAVLRTAVSFVAATDSPAAAVELARRVHAAT